MKRVVITGIGIVSCLGNNKEEVATSLMQSASGISFCEDYAEKGLRSQIAGRCQINFDELIERKARRFMGDAAAYTYISMQQAIEDSGLTPEEVSHPRTGLVVGSGGGSPINIVDAADALRDRGLRRVGPYMVTRTMSSTTSACLATPFKIKGMNYTMTSACSTSLHCIGHASELIQMGKQDVVFAGGGEEENWSMTSLFDAMGALSTQHNDQPTTASRPFDATRDGFVIAGGGGVLVLESLEHAQARGAKIYAELVGYGATSDGHDMVAPSGEGALRCMQMAMATVDTPIDYINTHGTSTPAGDSVELKAIKAAFEGQALPHISSTKSISGHSLGAAGVHESIYSLLMMERNFIAASANFNTPDPEAEGMPIVSKTLTDTPVTTVLSNSFGFGGTNGSLVFRKFS